mgnify:CR=1 FL=1
MNFTKLQISELVRKYAEGDGQYDLMESIMVTERGEFLH